MNPFIFSLPSLSIFNYRFPLCLIPLLLAACDPGSISTCIFVDQAACHPPEQSTDLGSGGKSDPPVQPRLPSTTRSFREVKRLPLDTSQQFAGLYQNDAIVKEADKTFTRVIRITGSTTIDYTTTKLSFGQKFPLWYTDPFDKIYFTALSPYFIQYAPKFTSAYSASGSPLWSSVTDEHGTPPRAFFDSQTNSFSVSALQGDTTHFYAHLEGTQVQHSIKGRKASAHVIGDLDKFDKTGNGLEFITIANNSIETIKHQQENGNIGESDPELARALSQTLIIAAGALYIKSACIVDINDDELMDFVYTVGGSIRVVSYLGRSWVSSNQAFFAWPIGPAPGLYPPEILSISPINIDGNQFPDLLVETKEHLIYLLNGSSS